MAAIEARGLTFTYPRANAPALKNLTFQVEAGQLVAVTGANGAGKSTLCLALAGLIPALFQGQMAGEVMVGGLDTRRHSPGEFAGQAGLVLQNPANQLSNLRYTVYEEVAFGLENLGIAPAEMRSRIERALSQTGLGDLSERSPYTLSGGQQQRLALASILALQPPILLLDEPTAMLDPQGGREIYEIVQQLARAGTAVVAAELHLEWIARYADRVIALSKGEIILDGPPQEVLVSPLLLQAGIGWQRHTQAARLAQEHELWPAGRPLPATLQQAEEGFRAGRKNETRI